MIAFDANIWIAKFDPLLRPVIDPSTGQQVEFAKERVDALIDEITKQGKTLLVPTPVLAEVLSFTDDRRYEMLELLSRVSAVQEGPFDTKAAVELAEVNILAAAVEANFSREEPYQKIKIDRQIVAICKTNSVETFYTTDRSLKNYAERSGLTVKHLADIPLPPEARQGKLL